MPEEQQELPLNLLEQRLIAVLRDPDQFPSIDAATMHAAITSLLSHIRHLQRPPPAGVRQELQYHPGRQSWDDL